jgi:hypothetical protein
VFWFSLHVFWNILTRRTERGIVHVHRSSREVILILVKILIKLEFSRQNCENAHISNLTILRTRPEIITCQVKITRGKTTLQYSAMFNVILLYPRQLCAYAFCMCTSEHERDYAPIPTCDLLTTHSTVFALRTTSRGRTLTFNSCGWGGHTGQGCTNNGR